MDIKYNVKIIINLKHTLNTIDKETIEKDLMHFDMYKIYKGQKDDSGLTSSYYLTSKEAINTYEFTDTSCIVYSSITVFLEESDYNDPDIIKEKLKEFLEYNIKLVFEDSDPTSICKTKIKYIDIIDIEPIEIED